MDHTATPQSANPQTTLEQLDAQMLCDMFEGAAGWLERHVSHINALNVFPVPDGDTGTNMMLTVQSAIKELRSREVGAGDPVGDVANRMQRGALMGARGNSGVILSQILRGLAEGMEGKSHCTTDDLARAFENARDRAYKSVHKPVEGTILTVIREAADAVTSRAQAGETNVVALFNVAVEAAKKAELRTPELLPVLKEAGVTDSGGHGLWVFLDGALRRLRGEEIGFDGGGDMASFTDFAATVGHPSAEGSLHGEWGYDIQFLIKPNKGERLDVETIREHIASIGDCPLVVGDETLVKVHVHCPNPGPPITYGAEQGILFDVVVENMDDQAEQFLDEPAAAPTTTVKRTEEVTGIAIVAVAPGDGLAEVFRSLGVSHVVSGGQTMNPSTKDLLDAVEAVGSDTVIILPNNKNIILSAQQVPPLSNKSIHVLPTRTVPQGIAAVMSFNYAGDVDGNIQTMQEAVDHVQTGEVTTGVRTTVVGGVSVKEGDIIGLLNGKLVVAESDPETTVRALLEQIDLDGYEIITFYHGDNVRPEEAEQLIERLQGDFDGLEMTLLAGGQPHYHYIFSVE